MLSIFCGRRRARELISFGGAGVARSCGPDGGCHPDGGRAARYTAASARLVAIVVHVLAERRVPAAEVQHAHFACILPGALQEALRGNDGRHSAVKRALRRSRGDAAGRIVRSRAHREERLQALVVVIPGETAGITGGRLGLDRPLSSFLCEGLVKGPAGRASPVKQGRDRRFVSFVPIGLVRVFVA